MTSRSWEAGRNSLSRGTVITAVALLLISLGLVMLYSATAITSADRFGDPFHFLKRQALWAVLGVAVMFVVSRLDYHLWVRLGPWFAAGAMLLLLLVLVPGLGNPINGSRRWFRLGGVHIQVSEPARMAFIFAFVRWLCRDPEVRGTFWKGFVPCFATALMGSVAIAMEPDVGGSLFFMTVMIAIMLAGGIRLAHLVPAAALSVGGLGVVAFSRLEYVVRRLQTFFEPDADPYGVSYQLQQSLIALGSGGFLGEGLGRGVQKLRFLPEPHSDFILAVIGEELGFVGAASVLVLFAALCLAGLQVAAAAADREGRLLAFAISFMISLQAAVNAGVVTGILPTTGMPLPLVSYGGSSMLVTCAELGVLIRISQDRPGFSGIKGNGSQRAKT